MTDAIESLEAVVEMLTGSIPEHVRLGNIHAARHQADGLVETLSALQSLICAEDDPDEEDEE